MIGVLITARLGSSRLPNKHLIEADGNPFIYWLYSRLEHVFEKELLENNVKIIICTSEKEENKKFLSVLEKSSVEVFFGSDHNIPLRHLQCAEKYGFSHIVSVDGDDILCSAVASKKIADAFHNKETEHYDLISVSGLPLGMNVSGYATKYLKSSLEKSNFSKLETGWGRIFNEPNTFDMVLGDYPIVSDLRFTLDYPEDALFFKTIIEDLKEKALSIEDHDLITFVMQKEYFKINAHLSKVYWENYYAEKEKESLHEL